MLFGPLLSLGASGDIGDGIQFVCGKYVRKKPREKVEDEEEQKPQNLWFGHAIAYWNDNLTPCVKVSWQSFARAVNSDVKCSSKIGVVTGYNLWIMFFTKFKDKGRWPDFPEPPGYNRCLTPPGGWPAYPPV